jgi:DNA-binding MurR/RpiR family transcriptional regulator
MARTDGTGSAPSNQTLLTHIRSLLPSLAPAERRVAEAAVADPAGVATKTISQLATMCDTSETTVVRFCRAIGIRGYPELRIALASAAGRADSAGQAAGVGSDIGPEDSLADVLQKVGYADAHAVQDTVRQLDTATLGVVIEAIVAARRVDIYGVGASAFVALDLQQKLHRIGRMVYAWPDPHTALTSAALLDTGDVAIGFSHTGETNDTIVALAEARRRGATAVAVTNYPRSSIVDSADHVVTTAARETTFRSGAMASRIAALTIVDCIFVGVAQRNYAETLLALERTHDAVAAVHHRIRGKRPKEG